MTMDGHIAAGTLFESARFKSELDSTSQTHLNDCNLCQETLSWMMTTANMGTEEATYEPPASAVENVLRLGRPSKLKQLRNLIVASLTFDSASRLAPVGVRSAETNERQLTYQAEGIEIGLSMRRSENRTLTLTGQVLRQPPTPNQDTSASIDLVVEGDHVANSTLSPWGEFVFSNVPDADYTLHIALPDLVVRVPLSGL